MYWHSIALALFLVYSLSFRLDLTICSLFCAVVYDIVDVVSCLFFFVIFFLFLFYFIFIFVAVDAIIVVAGWCKMYLNFKYGIVCECWTQEIWIQRHQPKQKTENWKHQQQQQKNVTKMPMAIIWKLHTHSKVHYECAKRKRNAAGLPGWALNTQRTHTYCSNPIRIEYTQRRR